MIMLGSTQTLIKEASLNESQILRKELMKEIWLSAINSLYKRTADYLLGGEKRSYLRALSGLAENCGP